MFDIAIDLYKDWNDTVREIFRGSGYPLPDELSGEELGVAYFMQTAETEEEAERLRAANEDRMKTMQRTILEHFDTVILPDICSRTDYKDNRFSFKWVYKNGEHIIEEHSSYRIPL